MGMLTPGFLEKSGLDTTPHASVHDTKGIL